MQFCFFWGRLPIVPIDMLFGSSNASSNGNFATPKQYIDEVVASLKQIWDSVRTYLETSKKEMIMQYNKGVRSLLPAEGWEVYKRVVTHSVCLCVPKNYERSQRLKCQIFIDIISERDVFRYLGC